MSTPQKSVWLFRDGDRPMRDLMGGKGAGLAEMTNIGLSVPASFTVTTERYSNKFTLIERNNGAIVRYGSV